MSNPSRYSRLNSSSVHRNSFDPNLQLELTPAAPSTAAIARSPTQTARIDQRNINHHTATASSPEFAYNDEEYQLEGPNFSRNNSETERIIEKSEDLDENNDRNGENSNLNHSLDADPESSVPDPHRNNTSSTVPNSTAVKLAQLYSFSSFFWLSLICYFLSLLNFLSSWFSNSWVENSANYSTIRGKNHALEWLLDSFAAFFMLIGSAALFPYLRKYKYNPAHYKNSAGSIDKKKILATSSSTIAAILAFLTCYYYSESEDALQATEKDYEYGASFILMQWAGTFSSIAAGLLIFHEIIEFLRYKRGQSTEPSENQLYLQKYHRRNRLSVHQRSFLHFLLLSLALMYGGSWLYSALEHWNMRLSLLFTVAMLATIGSSNLVPSTIITQLFTVFYFPTGAALVLYTLNLGWKYLLFSFISNLNWLNKRWRGSSSSPTAPSDPISPDLAQYNQLYITLVFSLCWSLFGSLLFSYLEEWSLWNSIWFCFATLTTIGFGDYFPQKPRSSLFLVLFIIIGFGAVASIMSSLAGIYTNSLNKGKLYKIEQRRKKLKLKHRNSALIQRRNSRNYSQDTAGMNSGRRGSFLGHSGSNSADFNTLHALKQRIHEFTLLREQISPIIPVEQLEKFNFHMNSYFKHLQIELEIELRLNQHQILLENRSSLSKSGPFSAGNGESPEFGRVNHGQHHPHVLDADTDVEGSLALEKFVQSAGNYAGADQKNQTFSPQPRENEELQQQNDSENEEFNAQLAEEQL
jgi:hypothetical protein